MTYTYGNPMPDADAQSASPARVLTRQRLLAVCAAMLVAVTTSSSGQTPAARQFPSRRRGARVQRRPVRTGGRGAAGGDRRTVDRPARARPRLRGAATPTPRSCLPASSRRVPCGDAALELGLLHLYLGRRDEGARLLQAVLTRGPQNSPADLLRLGLAARALGRFQDANAFLRSAAGPGPRRSGHQHRLGRAVPRKVQPRRRGASRSRRR